MDSEPVAPIPQEEPVEETPEEQQPDSVVPSDGGEQYRPGGEGAFEAPATEPETKEEEQEEPKPEEEQQIEGEEDNQDEDKGNSVSLDLSVPKKPRSGTSVRKPGNAWKQMEGLVAENTATTPTQHDFGGKLETEAEQEIAAALFDLANAAKTQQDDDMEEMEAAAPRARVPRGHNPEDTLPSSRKRPRKPNRNLLMFEDPGDDEDDEDWDAEDEYLHQRSMASRGGRAGRVGGRGVKNSRQDYSQPPAGRHMQHPMYDDHMMGGGPHRGGPPHPQYMGQPMMPYPKAPHAHYPPSMLNPAAGPPGPPQAAPRFKRGANHIAIAHFIQWHKQAAGNGGYAAPPPAPAPQAAPAPPHLHPQMMAQGMLPQMAGRPDMMQVLSQALQQQQQYGMRGRSGPQQAQARPPGAFTGMGMAQQLPASAIPGQGGAGRGGGPADLGELMQLKQINQLLQQTMQRQQQQRMGGAGAGGPPANAAAAAAAAMQQVTAAAAAASKAQQPGAGQQQPGGPRPAVGASGAPPGGLSQDAIQALRALQTALPVLTTAASGQASQAGGADVMRALQQTLQSAISKLPAGQAGAAAAAAAGAARPGAPPGATANNSMGALAGALAAILNKQPDAAAGGATVKVENQGATAPNNAAPPSLSPAPPQEVKNPVGAPGSPAEGKQPSGSPQPQANGQPHAEEGAAAAAQGSPAPRQEHDTKEGQPAPVDGETLQPAGAAAQPARENGQVQAQAQGGAVSAPPAAGAAPRGDQANALAALRHLLGGHQTEGGIPSNLQPGMQALLQKIASSNLANIIRTDANRNGGPSLPLSQLMQQAQAQQQQQPPPAQ